MASYYSDITTKIDKFFSFDNDTICHYTSPYALKSILSKKELRFTDYRFLNDKTEGTYIHDVIASLDLSQYSVDFRNAIENAQKSRVTITDIVSNRLSNIPNPSTKVLGAWDVYLICCFSTDSNNLAMWNYYTKTSSGMGYNVVLYTQDLHNHFSVSLSQSSINGVVFFKKVVYDEKSQHLIVKSILDYYYSEWKKTKNQEVLEESLYNVINEVRVFIKNPCFALENEVRAIIKIPCNEYYNALRSDVIKIAEKDGYFVPYIDLCFGTQEELKQVTISPKGEFPFANHSVRLLMNKYGYEFGRIVNSTIPLR